MRFSASSQLVLVSDSDSQYSIVIPNDASLVEQKASVVLQNYLSEISGARIPIITDKSPAGTKEICIGNTNRGTGPEKLINEGFMIKTRGAGLYIYGKEGKSTLYGVYHFLENYLGCRKYTARLKYVPKQRSITIPVISDLQISQFAFRTVYYPDQYDEEFRDWHKLHILEEQFGLWGHTYNKLVPPAIYFQSHPEYYALVNGGRTDTQLCLSNPAVLNILTGNLRKLINEQPDKSYWSVSQNDGFGFCTCSSCEAIDRKYGGAQGSVIHFANKVAAKFPGKTISTLAYLYSASPPVNLKPAANLSVMMSSISMDRSKPIAANPRAAAFRNNVRGWAAISKSLMMWDYVVQYTNYQSPFPNVPHLRDNMKFFADNKITGIFAQGTETGSGEFYALKTYLLAKAAWSPQADLKQHYDEFINAYYGEAGQDIKRYINELSSELAKSKRVLDIYGDPVNEWNTWLTPVQIDKYSDILDEASRKAGSLEPFAKNVEAERLALEFAVIQQTRFYGLEKHGLFTRSGNSWSVRPGMENKVERFIDAARQAGVRVLAEGGHTIDSYAQEWEGVFREGPIIHNAIGAEIKPLIPFSPEYPGKGARGLTDGSRGYNNFQYNYVGWYGTDMEVVIDLGEIMEVGKVSAGFLEDQRHWAFLPVNLNVEISVDNASFHNAGRLELASPEENYAKETHRFTVSFAKQAKARYIKFKAKNLDQLPRWRAFPNRKSWLFCDEIAVFE